MTRNPPSLDLIADQRRLLDRSVSRLIKYDQAEKIWMFNSFLPSLWVLQSTRTRGTYSTWERRILGHKCVKKHFIQILILPIIRFIQVSIIITH